MKLSTQLARDSLWLFLARVAGQLSLVAVTFLLARRLGQDGFGEYAFLATIIMIGNVFTTFGSDMFLIREIAAKGDFSSLSSTLILQLILSCLFIACVFLVTPLLPNQTSESIQALRIYSFALIPLAFFTVFTSVLRGLQRFSHYAWLNLIVPAMQVVAIFLYIPPGTSIVNLAYLLLVVQILGTLFSGVFCVTASAVHSNEFHFSFATLRSLLALCLPIALIAIAGIVYQRLSLVMLSVLGTTSMMGLFSAAARTVEAARIGHIAVLTALYPAMANAHDHPGSRKTLRASWLVLLAGSALGALFLFILAAPIVNFFFGKDYAAAIPALQILAFTLMPYTVSSFLSLALLARKKERVILGVLTVGLLAAILNNVWLIPRIGVLGACWGTLLAETAQAALFLWAWRRTPLHDPDSVRRKGASYELSDLS